MEARTVAEESATTVPPGAVLGLASAALLRLPLDRLADIRRAPGPGPGADLAPNFLRLSDEQTVGGISAVCYAAKQLGPFNDWGVVAVPHLLARAGVLQAAHRYLSEGAWGCSPHFIPHRSLHAVSGTISLALQARGPNFGVAALADAFLAAVSMLDEGDVPGVWLIATAFDPEPDLNSAEPTDATPCVIGLALAVTSERRASDAIHLQVGAASAAKIGSTADHPAASGAQALEKLIDWLDGPRIHVHHLSSSLRCQAMTDRARPRVFVTRVGPDQPGGAP